MQYRDCGTSLSAVGSDSLIEACRCSDEGVRGEVPEPLAGAGVQVMLDGGDVNGGVAG